MRRSARTAPSNRSAVSSSSSFSRIEASIRRSLSEAGHFHYIGNFGSGIQQGLDQRLRRQSAMQAFALKRVLCLARGIELFFSAVAGGKVLGSRLHLPRRSQRAG